MTIMPFVGAEFYRRHGGGHCCAQSGFNIGGSRTIGNHYLGGGHVFDDSKYGIPLVEEGETRLTPQRHAVTIRAGGNAPGGGITSYRATRGIKRDNHNELDGDVVATHFDNDTEEGEVLLSHKQFGRLSGSLGGSFLSCAFNTEGEEVLSPPVKQKNGAAFLYEEFVWPHATLQLGGRVDHTSFSPEGGLPGRTFNEFSGSVGLVARPAAANDKFVLARNLARAARNPALEELYYFGAHPGNFAFEIGNPNLPSERALGLDVSVRGRTAISHFIFRSPLEEAQVMLRTTEFNTRFGASGPIVTEFPVIENISADSVLQGVEAHADIELTPEWSAGVSYDMVRGELKDSGDPLPRIPPFRVMSGLRYRSNAFQVGGNVTHAGDQGRVFGAETPTPGYTLLRLFASYSFVGGGVTNTVTARLDNAGDKPYRNHLNYLKDVLPEMGRNFKVVYSVSF